MIPYEEALEAVLAAAWRLPAEEAPLCEARGRVLAADVVMDRDLPPFNRSSVDGYACRAADLGAPLHVIETIPAGVWPGQPVGPGQCAKIMTGAPAPAGADCVVMIEDTAPAGEGRIRYTGGSEVKTNIARRGEELRAGEIAIAAGTHLLAQHVAVLACAGAWTPLVARRPRAGVIATGSELAAPGAAPGPAQIRDSNSSQLAAQLAEAGCEVTDYGAAPDDAAALEGAIREALGRHDFVISTGGVSAGDYDLVPEVLAACGITPRLRRVAIQPGKPIAFGADGARAYFGLSGNPFSSFVQFRRFVLPFIGALTGRRPDPPAPPLTLGETFRRRAAVRRAWIPAAVRDGKVFKTPYHGSAHIHALTAADVLISFPPWVDALREGDAVPVEWIR